MPPNPPRRGADGRPPNPPDASRVSRTLPRVFCRPVRSHLPLHPPRRPRSSKELRQLYRDLIPNTLEKCITYDDLNDWPDRIQRDILHASARLAELVARKLARATLARTDDEDAEEDILCLLQALAWTLRRGRRVPSQARAGHTFRDSPSTGRASPSDRTTTRLRRIRRRRSRRRLADDDDRADGRTTTATATME